MTDNVQATRTAAFMIGLVGRRTADTTAGAADGLCGKAMPANAAPAAERVTGADSPKQFERLMVDAMPKLRRVAYSLTRSPIDADDLAQDTLERCWRYRDNFTMGSNFEGWACFIMRNKFLSDRRRAWRVVEMAEGQAEAVPCLPDALDALELKEALAALAYLDPPQAEALLMFALMGGSIEEAAEALGCAVGTIKSRVSRARDALAQFFRIALEA